MTTDAHAASFATLWRLDGASPVNRLSPRASARTAGASYIGAMTAAADPIASSPESRRGRGSASTTSRLTVVMAAVLVLYLPHLADEALTGMCDDPVIVTALGPLGRLSPRHATYLVFQLTFALALVVGFVTTLGERARLLVVGGIGLALVCEGHHVARALVSLHTNSGLLTSLPMPILGVLVLRNVARDWPPSSA